VDAETGDATVVVTPPLDDWFPDIAWLSGGHSFLATGAGPEAGLYRVDTQTGETSLVFANEIQRFALSPDGKTVYFPRAVPSTNEVAFIERDLAAGREREMIQRSILGGINLSPDGQYIATASTNSASNSRVVLLIPTAGGEARELLRVPSEVKAEDLNNRNLGQNITVLGWAPDGRSLLVRKVPSDRTKEVELWLVPLNGGESRKIVGDADIPANAAFSFSPDGRHFAYIINEPAPPAASEVAVLENFLPKTPPVGK
jgi:hypothetical protein